MTTKPIRIGYTLSLTGPLAANGRSAALAHRIWQDEVNGRGGLLGRPVELVCHDDGTDASRVAELYRKMMDDEKVDLVMGAYGTNSLLPAMPLMVERGRFFVGLMGVGVNRHFDYPGYLAMIPMGPDSNAALTAGFFELAANQLLRPARIAFLSADAEFSRNPIIGAHANAALHGMEVVDERVYDLETSDFAPIIEAVSQTKPDVLLLCSYLDDSVGLVRAIAASRWKPKLVGGAMIGPQSSSVKQVLGPLLNGFVNYEYWAPTPAMAAPGVSDMLRAYQARAVVEGVDELGHYMAPTAYAQLQVIEQAVQATGTTDDSALIGFAHSAEFDTVLGRIQFGADGEWKEARVLQVQFRDVADDPIPQFRAGRGQVVLEPSGLANGGLVYPYGDHI